MGHFDSRGAGGEEQGTGSRLLQVGEVCEPGGKAGQGWGLVSI